MIRDLQSLVALKCFSVECEEFLICFSTRRRHLEISRHNKGFVVSINRDQEQAPLTLGVLALQGEAVGAVVAAGRLHVLAGVVAVALGDLLVYRLALRCCAEKKGCQVDLKVKIEKIFDFELITSITLELKLLKYIN